MPEIKARLSNEAREGWDGFCAEHGVTLSGLIEAVGRLIYDGELPPLVEVDRVVALARQVDRERRGRH